MQPPHLPPTFTLLLLLHSFSLALPSPQTPSSPLPPLPPNPHCLNAPSIRAGTLLPRSLSLSLPLPRQREQSIVYCSPGTQTWINLLMGGYQHPLDVSNMLDIAINTLAARIVELGDGPLVNGRFLGSAGIGPGLNLVLRAANTNNHQTTRGVLRAALVALRGYMQEWGFGEVFLLIFDGQTLVGKAAIITEPAGA